MSKSAKELLDDLELLHVEAFECSDVESLLLERIEALEAVAELHNSPRLADLEKMIVGLAKSNNYLTACIKHHMSQTGTGATDSNKVFNLTRLPSNNNNRMVIPK